LRNHGHGLSLVVAPHPVAEEIARWKQVITAADIKSAIR
jgi:hypothetical protein